MEWQPIETAPKERAVLAYDQGPVFLTHTLTWMGVGKEMEYTWRDGSGDSFQDYRPTHWMPLPEPPNA